MNPDQLALFKPADQELNWFLTRGISWFFIVQELKRNFSQHMRFSDLSQWRLSKARVVPRICAASLEP